MGTSVSPSRTDAESMSPLVAGSRSHGVWERMSEFAKLHRAGWSRSLPDIRRVTFRVLCMASGFDRPTLTSSDTNRTRSKAIGWMQPSAAYAASV
eukprot:1429097-Prymnesium_polylepis.1